MGSNKSLNQTVFPEFYVPAESLGQKTQGYTDPKRKTIHADHR